MLSASLRMSPPINKALFLSPCASSLQIKNNRHLTYSRLSMCTASPSASKKKTSKKSEDENLYSHTVLLPKTTFEQRANSAKREPEIQKFWDDYGIYEKLKHQNKGEKFVLHDGPPYANGDLHIGHALNKILKDIINKYQILRGKKVTYVPGWDCHGLPIELKVLQSLNESERKHITPVSLREKAATFAKSTMASQRESFKRYGVWGDWNQPYMTLDNDYEASQIRVFGLMVERGHIYRGKKPVHWSPSSRSALAEAELEYPENHVSRSIYVGFEVVEPSQELEKYLHTSDRLRVAIWTTTPWTIPANLAVAVNGALDYSVISHPKVFNNAKFIVAKELVSNFTLKVGVDCEIDGAFTTHAVVSGQILSGTKYRHPLYDRISTIVIGGDYITTESGTGLVHTAPGHGHEDYLTGIKYDLPLLSPVDDAGKFTIEAGEKFVGMDVLTEGNAAIISALQECGALLREEAYNHKYPYDWRTKKPTIFRATEQWFASVSTFRDEALRAINSISFIPAIGKTRLSNMVVARNDWCISRQRSWGVPIPVFYRNSDGKPLMTGETISFIEQIFRQQGSDAWWKLSVAELLPPGSLRDSAHEYCKGMDTMDVWFDSGTSWSGILQSRSDLKYPADIYLEGSDQHRGWFQSSLLTSIASQGVPPYKTVLTHGFVLDEKGYKMSKSLGNVVDPKVVINGGSNQKEKPALGADTLRLWVSSVDYTGDVCVGDNIMKIMSETYRKIRNTLRFVVGSLNDYNDITDRVSYESLPSIDKYILGQLSIVMKEVETAYNEYRFDRVHQAIVQFCITDLSSFYFDISKDRLYISSKQDQRRKSCQSVLYVIMEQLAVALAPLVPHLAEDLWQNRPPLTKNISSQNSSVFERGWVKNSEIYPPHRQSDWEKMKTVKEDVNRCVEVARNSKLIGPTQEASVKIYSKDKNLMDLMESLIGDDTILPTPVKTNNVDDLRFVWVVSQIELSTAEEIAASCAHVFNGTDVVVGINRAKGKRCERCWYYCESVGKSHGRDDLCARCNHVLVEDRY